MPDQAVADFALPATGGVDFNLSAARGKSLVLYFYPKDNTPGCTMESQQFSSTFVLDRHGVMRREWRGAKADDHAHEVLSFVKTL